ncbi:MAG: cell division protein FtsQ/DivIB [Bryobacteraceae bacterium]|jgi:cell division protein FtsQ
MPRETKKSEGIRWRLWLTLAALGAVCASTALGALEVRRYALTDSRFTLSRDRPDALAIQGLTYAPRAKVWSVFEEDFGRSVFSIPLAERRRSLLAIDWVADASVSRIVPDRLLIRIRERQPVAFAAMPSGVMLVDAEGVLLEPPPRGRFTFPALSGLQEQETETQRRGRVQAFLRFQRDMGYLANSVSEVDVTDPGDLRIVTQAGDHAVDLLMGGEDFARRYQNFVNHYAEMQAQSPGVRTFDLRMDDWITARQ